MSDIGHHDAKPEPFPQLRENREVAMKYQSGGLFARRVKKSGEWRVMSDEKRREFVYCSRFRRKREQ